MAPTEAPPEEWQRARRPEHKAARRDAILAAAGELLDEEGLDRTTLSAIARRAGLSKANCYRYFESREAILLEIILEEGRGWTTELVDALELLRGTQDIDAVARTYATITARRRRFCMLASSLASVLEHNVSAETVAAFKQRFHPELVGSAGAIRAACSNLTDEQAQTFLHFFGLVVIGTWPNANPAPAVEEVLSRDSFAAMRVDLETTLFEHGRVVLRGLGAVPKIAG